MSEATVRKSLKERSKEFSVRLPFMEAREKGEIKDILGQVCTIRDYGFLKGEKNNDYVVIVTDEYPKTFYFGGQVLTDQMQQLEAEGYHDEINEAGLPFVMTEKKSKNNKTYVNVMFYPDED
jgi:hypothetical protein